MVSTAFKSVQNRKMFVIVDYRNQIQSYDFGQMSLCVWDTWNGSVYFWSGFYCTHKGGFRSEKSI